MEITGDKYITESHSEELDDIFGESSFDFKAEDYKSQGVFRDVKAFIRYCRRKFKSVIREGLQKNFTNILYLTLDCPPYTKGSTKLDSPLDYIDKMRKQYPYNDIRVLIPIIGIEEGTRPARKITVEVDGKQQKLERTSLNFEIFSQNKKFKVFVYKYPDNLFNIRVYGIFSEAFSYLQDISELSKLYTLAQFMKSTRFAVNNFKKVGFEPDIVHSEYVPYYLGCEFESQVLSKPKVLQIVKDFTQIEMSKPESFWAAINFADEGALSKICRDNVIKKCLATLFNLRETRRFARMRDCLEFIYQNYSDFRKYVEQGEGIEENAIFNRLNIRITQIFPGLDEKARYYNMMELTLKKADFWAVVSKTYYKEIFQTPKISGKIYPQIEKTKDKSSYVLYGCDISVHKRNEGREIYQTFDVTSFRAMRSKNKSILRKEFNIDRIKTNFIDETLFNEASPIIKGNLDSFYDAPLLFANTTTDIFANGVDILFNTLLKLFDLHKNIQVIICIKNGIKNNFIKSWVDFLSENKNLNGRWVFIDGEINEPKFLAASDIILIPRRTNLVTPEHFIAMYYGCVPVVAGSGILNDNISDIFDDITKGCGFKTQKSLLTEDDNPEIFLTPLTKALTLYQNNPSSWNLLIKNCLNYDSDWSFKILEKYNKIYQELM